MSVIAEFVPKTILEYRCSHQKNLKSDEEIRSERKEDESRVVKQTHCSCGQEDPGTFQLSSDDVFTGLSKAEFFSLISAGCLRFLVSESQLLTFSSGQVIFRPREKNRSVFVLFQGTVGEYRNTTNVDSYVASIVKLAPNLHTLWRANFQVFGDAALFLGYTSSHLLIAHSLCRFVRIGADSLRTVLLNQPNSVWSVASRLREKYPDILEDQKVLVDTIYRVLIDQVVDAGRQWDLSPRSQAMEPRTFHKLPDHEKWQLTHTKPKYLASVEETSPISLTPHPQDELRKMVSSEGPSRREATPEGLWSQVDPRSEAWTMQCAVMEQPLIKVPGGGHKEFWRYFSTKGSTRDAEKEMGCPDDPESKRPATTQLGREIQLRRRNSARRKDVPYDCHMRFTRQNCGMQSILHYDLPVSTEYEGERASSPVKNFVGQTSTDSMLELGRSGAEARAHSPQPIVDRFVSKWSKTLKISPSRLDCDGEARSNTSPASSHTRGQSTSMPRSYPARSKTQSVPFVGYEPHSRPLNGQISRMENQEASRRSASGADREDMAPYKTYACELRNQSPYVSVVGPLAKGSFASIANETHAGSSSDGFCSWRKAKGSYPELPHQSWLFHLKNSRNSSEMSTVLSHCDSKRLALEVGKKPVGTFTSTDKRVIFPESQHVSREGGALLAVVSKPRQTWVCLERNRSHSR